MTSKTTIKIKTYPPQPVIEQSGSTAVVAGTLRPGATVFTIRIPSEHGELAWTLQSALFGMKGIYTYTAPWKVKVIVTADQSPETIRGMIEYTLTRDGIEFEIKEE